MQVHLDELRLEESAALFKDTAEAIGSIADCILPMVNQDREQHMLMLIANLRKGVSRIIDAYEKNDLAAIQKALDYQLIPAFSSWQHELSHI
jgi:hypothetical protein